MNVTVYTTATCPYCNQVKGYLSQKGVQFVEKRVDLDHAAANEMIRVSGQRGVPVVVIDEQAVVGFNRPAIDQLLSQRVRTSGPKLGAAVANAQKYTQTPGAYVGRVTPNSPAARAGVQVGDVIVEINRRHIHNADDLTAMLNTARPGQVLKIALQRAGRMVNLDLQL